MRADGFVGQLIQALSRRTPAFQSGPGTIGSFGQEIVTALGRSGPAFLPQHEPDASRLPKAAEVESPMTRDSILAAIRDGKSLVGANLNNADLSSTNLRHTDFHGANLTDADLRGTNLSNAILRYADLTDANVTNAILGGANLHYAWLRGADLRGADLRYVDLRGADLFGADLRGADLDGADLRGAGLIRADLRDVDLRDADLLVGSDLGGARWNSRTSWPEERAAEIREASDEQPDGSFRVRSGGSGERSSTHAPVG